MPTNFGTTPYSTETLPANTFPVSAVFVPGTASGNLTAMQGGPATTDANGYTSAPGAIYIADGSSVTLGSLGDTAGANSVVGQLKQIRLNTTSVTIGTLPALPAGSNTIGGVELVDSGGTNKASISISGAVKVDGSAVTQPVSGTFWQATQPISAASLPLPTGASTSAKQPALGVAGTASSDVITVQGIASMTPLKTDGSGVTQPVSGSVSVSNFPGTQTVSGTVTVQQSTASNLKVDLSGTGANTTAIKVDGSAVTQPVSGTFWQATQPVSGTITANAGTGTFTNQQTNVTADYDSGAGTQNMTMFGVALPASGGAVAGGTSSNPIRTDPTGTTTQPVSGSISVSNFPATQTISGTVTANAGTNLNTSLLALESGGNLATIATRTPALGQATMANSRPVVIASDQTTIPVQDVVASANGAVPYHNLSGASTNFTNVKGSACQLYGCDLSNTSASAIYVKFYDKATAPATTDTPKRTIQVPANGTVLRVFPKGLHFANGLGWAATGAVADNDNTAIAANCVIDFDLNS